MAMRELLANEREELVHLDERVKRFDAQLDALVHDDPARRLQTIPGASRTIALSRRKRAMTRGCAGTAGVEAFAKEDPS